jgi:hypothetical protein
MRFFSNGKNSYTIDTKSFHIENHLFFAMSAEESIPFIPEFAASSTSSITGMDDADSINLSDDFDAEKGGPYKDGGYEEVEQYGLQPIAHSRGGKLWNHVKTYSRHSALGFLTLLALGIFAFMVIRRVQTPKMVSQAAGRIPGIEYTPDGRVLSCGNTFEEAEAAGCIFDMMTFVYTPPACYDEELALSSIDPEHELAPYRATGTWPWWTHENHTEPLPQEPALLSSLAPVWTNNVYHRAHCIYLWRLGFRALMRMAEGKNTEVYVYEKLTKWDHLTHCNRLLNDLERPEDAPARAVKLIGKCVRLDSAAQIGGMTGSS